MCSLCRGGPKWAPYTLGGVSVEITWQEGRLDDKHSGSHPEANVLALADKELHQGVDSHPVDSHPEVNVLALVV